MGHTVSIITPAYRAEPFIASAVARHRPELSDSLLFIVSDDGQDYQALLEAQGLAENPRLRFLYSGQIGGGASRARNLALDVIDTPYIAVLDADDRFKPAKLERAVAALAEHPIVTCALGRRGSPPPPPAASPPRARGHG